MRNRFFLLLLLLAGPMAAQNVQELIRPVPDEFVPKQWNQYKRAWVRQGPWVRVELHDGQAFNGQILHDERGVGFHMWTTTDFFDPQQWDQHYQFFRYEDILRINELLAYNDQKLGFWVMGGTLTGAAIGSLFYQGPTGGLIGGAAGAVASTWQHFMRYNGSPRLLYLRRQVGGTYYKDFRLGDRQVFGNGLPDTTQIRYLTKEEWVPQSTMLSKVFYQPQFQGYAGGGIAFMPQAPITAAPYWESVIGMEGQLIPEKMYFLGAELASVMALTNPSADEPLLRYIDASVYAAFAVTQFDRFGVQGLRVAPEAGVLLRSFRYQFGTVNGTISETYNLVGGKVGVKVDYRLGHRMAVWGRGVAKIVPGVEVPWPTPEFDPNILQRTTLSTTSFNLQAGFSFSF